MMPVNVLVFVSAWLTMEVLEPERKFLMPDMDGPGVRLSMIGMGSTALVQVTSSVALLAPTPPRISVWNVLSE